MMFYREIELGEKARIRQRHVSHDPTADVRRHFRHVPAEHLQRYVRADPNEDVHNMAKTTNFSISEILRPEFGQRKAESMFPELFTMKQEPMSPNDLINNPVSHCHGQNVLNFGDIYRRYRTLMFPSSQYTDNHSSGSEAIDSKDSIYRTITKHHQTISIPQSDSPNSNQETNGSGSPVWPAWVYCTRYSDRPSAGPRAKKSRHHRRKPSDEKRPRTAFSSEQLDRLKTEFGECRYLTENRRTNLAKELGLTESQIKIWFQNKRAKVKKTSDTKNTLALNLIAEGLYNHSIDKPKVKRRRKPAKRMTKRIVQVIQ